MGTKERREKEPPLPPKQYSSLVGKMASRGVKAESLDPHKSMVAAPLSATESLPTALGPGPHHPIRWFPCPPGVPGPRQHGRWVVASCRAPYLTGHSRDLCTHSHPRPKGASENSVFVQCLCWVVLLKGLRQA